MSDNNRKPTGGMGQKPRVPVGPRRTTSQNNGDDALQTQPDRPSASPSVRPAQPQSTADSDELPELPYAPGERPKETSDDALASTLDSEPPRNTRRTGSSQSPAPRVTAGKATTSDHGVGASREKRPSGVTSRNAVAAASASGTRTLTRNEKIRRGLLIAGGVMAGGALLGVLGLMSLFWYYGRDLPDVKKLANWVPPQTTRIVARDGTTVLAELFIERRTMVPNEKIPKHLASAFLAAEDAEFYRHEGLNYLGMMRAFFVNLRSGRFAQGGSTITQQLIKNVLLTPERTLERKVKELLLARKLEREFTKDQILNLYLNYIGLGHGRNGIEEASRFYFGKHVEDLTLAESALLAGIPKDPTHYSPKSHPKDAATRRHWILGRMVENHFVTQAEADAADRVPVESLLRDETEQEHYEGISPEVVEAVRAQLKEKVGEEQLRRGGFTIVTTIDAALQRAARDAVQGGLQRIDTRYGYLGPLLAPGTKPQSRKPGNVLKGEAPPANGKLLVGHIYSGIVERTIDPDPSKREPGAVMVRVGEVVGRVTWPSMARYVGTSDRPSVFAPTGALVRVSVDRGLTKDSPEGTMRMELGPQAALVAIEPTQREVLALVGGYDAIGGMFDRASHGARQAGSSFKPFLYSLALSTGRYTLATTIDPTPACFDGWCPKEAHHSSGTEPPMRLREALAQSRNLVAARVVMDVGPQALVEHARKLGIRSELAPVPSLALGASDVTPMEMTNAYATWAAGGQYAPPKLILRVTGPDGKDIDLGASEPSLRVVTAEQAYLVTSMLTSVVDHGTGTGAKELRRPVAAKTGTTNGGKDGWFVGYTTDIVVGTWVGFDDHIAIASDASGASTALPVWLRFMKAYVAARKPPAVDFPRPPGVRVVQIDPVTGLPATAETFNPMDEVFLETALPGSTAPPVVDAGVTTPVPQVVDAGTATTPVDTTPEEPVPDETVDASVVEPTPTDTVPPSNNAVPDASQNTPSETTTPTPVTTTSPANTDTTQDAGS